MDSWGQSFYTKLQPWQDKSSLIEMKHIYMICLIEYGHIPTIQCLAIEAYYEHNLTIGKKNPRLSSNTAYETCLADRLQSRF